MTPANPSLNALTANGQTCKNSNIFEDIDESERKEGDGLSELNAFSTANGPLNTNEDKGVTPEGK